MAVDRPESSSTTGAFSGAMSRRGLLASLSAFTVALRSQSAWSAVTLESVIPVQLPFLTQTFQITSSGAVGFDELVRRLDNTPDAGRQLARFGYLDGYERVFESKDAIGDDARLVSMLCMRFQEARALHDTSLIDAAYLLANDRSKSTQLRFSPPDPLPRGLPFNPSQPIMLKLAGPSGIESETTYYGGISLGNLETGRPEGRLLVRLLTLADGDPTADTRRIMTSLATNDCTPCDTNPGYWVDLRKLQSNDSRWFVFYQPPDQSMYRAYSLISSNDSPDRLLVVKFDLRNLGLEPTAAPIGVDRQGNPDPSLTPSLIRLAKSDDADATQHDIGIDPRATQQYWITNEQAADPWRQIQVEEEVRITLVYRINPGVNDVLVKIGRDQPWSLDLRQLPNSAP